MERVRFLPASARQQLANWPITSNYFVLSPGDVPAEDPDYGRVLGAAAGPAADWAAVGQPASPHLRGGPRPGRGLTTKEKYVNSLYQFYTAGAGILSTCTGMNSPTCTQSLVIF